MTCKLHAIVADERTAVLFCLSPGQAHDAPRGRELLESLGGQLGKDLIADRAYEGDKTRKTATDLGYVTVIPPKRNRCDPWEYDRRKHAMRNKIERFFGHIKRYRRIATRYDKLDTTFTAAITLALIHTTLQNVNTP